MSYTMCVLIADYETKETGT